MQMETEWKRVDNSVWYHQYTTLQNGIVRVFPKVLDFATPVRSVCDSTAVFCDQPLSAAVRSIPAISSRSKPILLQGGATGVQFSWAEHHNPHSRKRANITLCWLFYDASASATYTYEDIDIFDVDTYGSRLSLRSWEYLPSQGRPPQLFPAPRTVKTWSLHCICGKAVSFSLPPSRQPQCYTCLFWGDYRVETLLCWNKLFSFCVVAVFIRSNWDPSISSFCICIPSESPRTSQTLPPSHRLASCC